MNNHKLIPVWDECYSINNQKIDSQHQKLFELAAKVENAVYKFVKRDELKEILIELFTYMKEHFHDEEEFMQKIQYPRLYEYRQMHKNIIHEMSQLIQNIKTTNDLKEKLYIVVKKWLLEHILYEDIKVEQWRIGNLSCENGDNFSFEEIKEENEEDEKAIYFYTCECIGQIHDVPYTIHKKMQNEDTKFKCKKCKTPLQFFKKGY